MDLFSENINWKKELAPILKKYELRKHPLEYHNLYQLLIMVILSAQDSDENINRIAPNFFLAFPNIEILEKSTIQEIIPYINTVKHHKNKVKWLIEIAKTIKNTNIYP